MEYRELKKILKQIKKERIKLCQEYQKLYI